MSFRERIAAVQSVVTIAAILTGGIWTYNLFIKERAKYPHANIKQNVAHLDLSDDVNLLRVDIELTNTGSTRLLMKKASVRIQQILPVLPCGDIKPCVVDQVNTALKETERENDKFSWPLLAERTKLFDTPLDIEPNEKDIVDFEFVVPSAIKAVRVYSYFRNELKSTDRDEVGWAISTLYDFRTPKKE